jgi:hypothetical protein
MSSLNTINGTLEAADGTPLKNVAVIFTPLDTPQFSGALITGNPAVSVTSDAGTGAFTAQLEPGDYGVQVMSNPVTAFQLAVPAGAGNAYSIGNLVTSATAALPSVLYGQSTSGTVRVKLGKGLQIYNFDTALWHTLICQGNPPQAGFDAGEA